MENLEIKDLELQQTETETQKPSWHYETIKEYTRDEPIYDEDGNVIGTKKVVTGRVVKKVFDDAILNAQERIKALKQQLADTDYRAIKYLEGCYTDEEFETYKEQRQSWRDEINQLEATIEQANETTSEEVE